MESDNERPLYRPRNWNKEDRDNMKADKVKGWYTRGGFKSVMFVPATPEAKLQKLHEKVWCENESTRSRDIRSFTKEYTPTL